ncbi:unnamed protein product [Arabidopsis lyrata]|nr:unnamed protein product [Arabidopsis lyrata]
MKLFLERLRIFLLQLDSIQGRVDSMIRDGKRSLSRDLVRFLHHIDGCAVKKRDFVYKYVKVVSFKGKCKISFWGKHDVGAEKLKKHILTV